MRPKALILLAYGTNRDLDVCEALELAGADPEIVPLNELRGERKRWSGYQLLVLPGGFSYADALGAGKLLAIDMKSYFSSEILEFVDSGKPVIGICNGFQALIKSGILPDEMLKGGRAESGKPEVTLTFNASGHFECRWVTLRPVSKTCLWTKDLAQVVECPVAHGEGNFQVADQSSLARLQEKDQIALTYIREDGSLAGGAYPENPNGSLLDIAGVTNARGNVLGLMPHPENHIHPWQHPRWTRGAKRGSGLSIFTSGVKYAAQIF